jgi:hypothetical protein
MRNPPHRDSDTRIAIKYNLRLEKSESEVRKAQYRKTRRQRELKELEQIRKWEESGLKRKQD